MTKVIRGFLIGATLLTGWTASAETRLSLEQAASRVGTDKTLAHEGEQVVVEGLVSTGAVWALGAYYLAIEDATEHGLILLGEAALFENVRAGDWIEARGKMTQRAGMPVLAVARIDRLSQHNPPPPKAHTIPELHGLRYLGLWVTTEGQVTSIGDNSGGDIARITDRGQTVTIFLPLARREAGVGLGRLRVGDRVRVSGLATQYCPFPPHDRGFQVLVPSAASVAVVGSGTLIPPLLLLTALVMIGLLLAIWWIRERRMAGQRRAMRTLHALSEEIIAAGSPGEIAEKLTTVLPKVTRATSARMFLYNRRTKSLELVPTTFDPEPMAIAIDTPPEGPAAGVAACFRNRSLLNIPDVRRSPLIKVPRRAELPRSLMFVPMLAQNDLVGVIEVGNADSPGYFTHEEQAATQHLANQVATSLKLQEQRTMREQLFRSEKLAATGQLISGVASELRAPLDSVLKLATALADHRTATERDLKTLASESQRASEIVARLVSFARAEDSEARLVEINQLLVSLMQFRDPEWKQLGLRVQNRLTPDPVYVLGSQGQLEQVFLNLLVHAEQVAMESPTRSVTVSSSLIARRVLIEISFPAPGENPAPDPFAEARSTDAASLGLGVARGILQTHSGEVRFRSRSGESRFEVELPVARAREEAIAIRAASRVLTLLLVEPDIPAQRQLLALFGSRGHRVVPCPSPEEAIDLAQRLKFDAVLCPVRLPGRNWVEFYESVRSVAGTFVLVSDGYDAELARTFQAGDGYLLSRPYQDSDIERMLKLVETRSEPSAAAGRLGR